MDVRKRNRSPVLHPHRESDSGAHPTMLSSPTFRSRSGVTILGVCVSLMAIALISSFAIPAFFERPSVTLESATDLFGKDVLDLQNQAVLGFETVELRFLDGGDGYSGHHRDGRLLPAPTGDGTFRREYSFNAVFRGVRMDVVELGEGNTLQFDRQGLALTSLRVLFAYEGGTCEVLVEEGSGRVIIGDVVEAE